MEIIDISKTIDENTEVYPGDPAFKKREILNIKNDGAAVSELVMGTHIATHIDSPAHVFLKAKNISDLPLDVFFGRCSVTSDALKRGVKRIILSNSRKDGEITPEEAAQIVNNGVVFIGTHSLSIGSMEVHRILLGAGIAVLENAELLDVEEGEYFLCCPPLKAEIDASPVRAVLIKGLL